MVVGVVLGMVLGSGCGDNSERPFEVRESVEQLHVTHAEPGVTLELVDGDGAVLQSALVDDRGSAIFRNVAPGQGYAVRGAGAVSGLEVMSVDSSLPAQTFYDSQVLEPGLAISRRATAPCSRSMSSYRARSRMGRIPRW